MIDYKDKSYKFFRLASSH